MSNLQNQSNSFFIPQQHRRKLTAIIFALSTLGATTATPTLANDAIAETLHTIMCAGLLISDPDRHLIECGIGDHVPGPLSDTSSGPAGVADEPVDQPKNDSCDTPHYYTISTDCPRGG